MSLISSLSRLALLPRAPRSWGGAARTERFYAAARAWREGLCVSRTRPLTLCVPHPFAFLFDRLSPGSPWRRFRLSSAFRLLLKPFIFSTPLAAVAFSDFRRFPRTRREGLCAFHLSFSQPLWQARPSLISDDFPGHAVRAFASCARPRTSTLRFFPSTDPFLYTVPAF